LHDLALENASVTYWAQLLHFYQPPTQSHDVLLKVASESYRPLLGVLSEHPEARIAVNINGVLTDMLQEHGLGDVVSGLRELGERGQVEFVGSGKFHPVLPLVPEGERVRSIAENARANHRAFGDAWDPRGFFPPEMCFGPQILPSIAAAGHEWVMLSGVACAEAWPLDLVYRAPAESHTMHVLFRDDARSNRISFRQTNATEFLDDLARVGGGEPAYVVTAMDAETYGHHINGWEREFLGEILERISAQKALSDRHRSRVETVFPSTLLDLFPPGPVIEPLPSSWSTTRDDIAAHNPYPLWRSPGNRVHELQWEYVDHCIELVAVAQRYAENDEARRFAQIASDSFQPALHSCQFWWASRRPMWDVPMVHRGMVLLNNVALYATKSIQLGAASDRVKREAGWRLAGANEARAELERELFGAAP
jgi:alpha-amylase/alpha-mannosidase (GH57 family)